MESKIGISHFITMIIDDEYFKKRDYRMVLESTMAFLCFYLKRKDPYSLFGNITDFQTVKEFPNEGYRLENYLQDKTYIKDGIIKVWNTR